MDGKRPGGWVALAWRYWRDPAILSVSWEAEAVWTHGLALSGEQETDGNLTSRGVRALNTKGRRGAASIAAELVDAGLWVETPSGYAVPFHTWSRWQETAEQRSVARTRAVERQAKHRAASRVTGGVTDPMSHGTSGAGAGAGAGHSPKSPDPPADPFVGNRDDEPELWQDAAGLWFAGRSNHDRPSPRAT